MNHSRIKKGWTSVVSTYNVAIHSPTKFITISLAESMKNAKNKSLTEIKWHFCQNVEFPKELLSYSFLFVCLFLSCFNKSLLYSYHKRNEDWLETKVYVSVIHLLLTVVVVVMVAVVFKLGPPHASCFSRKRKSSLGQRQQPRLGRWQQQPLPLTANVSSGLSAAGWLASFLSSFGK